MKQIATLSTTLVLALLFAACSNNKANTSVVGEYKEYENTYNMSVLDSPLIKQYNEFISKNTYENFDKEQLNVRPHIEEVDSQLPSKLLDYIYKKSEENDFSYELILALIKHESKLGKDKINYNNDGSVDKGIMQINSGNVYRLSKLAHINYPNLMDDYQSIDMAFALLNYERNHWREMHKYSEEQIYFLTILSYNIGSPKVPKFLHRYGWNSDYVDLITQYKSEFERAEVK